MLLRQFAFAMMLGVSSASLTATLGQAQVVDVTVRFAPPPLPVYVQPVIPASNYIWTPGYWAWEPETSYFWVPGTWVLAPRPGLLWTPGFWGYANGLYGFHNGYWGDRVGFYGGVVYGYGYSGNGYDGGRWQGGQFFYNRTVNNITNVAITNVYSQTVVVNRTSNNVSFNGGPGGTSAQPTPEQTSAANAQHVQPTAAQTQHVQTASRDVALRASQNNGKPAIAATQKPGEFKGAGVVPATAAGPQSPAPAPNAASAPKTPAGQTGNPPRPNALPGQPNGQALPAKPANVPDVNAKRPAAKEGDAVRPAPNPPVEPKAPASATRRTLPEPSARSVPPPAPAAQVRRPTERRATASRPVVSRPAVQPRIGARNAPRPQPPRGGGGKPKGPPRKR